MSICICSECDRSIDTDTVDDYDFENNLCGDCQQEREEPSLYSSTREASAKMGEKSDCAVVAVSIACGVEYDKVWGIMTSLGRKPRTGTMSRITEQTISKLGFHGKVTRPRKVTGGKFTAKTITDELRGKGRYLIFFRGHVAAMVNGRIEDWTQDRRHRVLRVIEILPGWMAKV